jgi:virulence factor
MVSSANQSPLRIAVIGAGGIASNIHLPVLLNHPGCDLVAICDLRRQRAAQAASEFGIPKTYELYDDMLAREEIDAVYVLTEPDQLFRPTLTCLRAGKHVFVEKPPGITSYQAETLVLAAREADRICMVGFNRRYAPVVREAVAQVRRHGGIHQIDVQFIKFAEAAFYDGAGSAFECDTIHVIDLMRWIAGAEASSGALVENPLKASRPTAWNAVIRFENGITGTVRANYACGGRVQTLEVHADAASAFVDLGFGGASCGARVLVAKAGTQSLTASASGGNKNEPIVIDRPDEWSNPRIAYGYAAETSEFVAAIQEKRRPLTDIEEGWRSMQLLDFLKARRI